MHLRETFMAMRSQFQRMLRTSSKDLNPCQIRGGIDNIHTSPLCFPLFSLRDRFAVQRMLICQNAVFLPGHAGLSMQAK